MEIIKISPENLFGICSNSSLVIKVPIDDTNNYRVSCGHYIYSCSHCNGDHFLFSDYAPNTAMSKLELVFSSELVLLKNTVSILKKENLHLRQQMEQMDKRLTTMEYHPPVNGGTEFHNLINEAKEAGDFS